MTSRRNGRRDGGLHLADAPDSVLDDLGVSRDQARALEDGERAARWARMAATVGADPGVISGDLELLREVATACARCGDHERCARWLGDDTAQPWAHQEFCPNHAIFDGQARDGVPRPRRTEPVPDVRRPVLRHLTHIHPDFRGGGRRP